MNFAHFTWENAHDLMCNGKQGNRETSILSPLRLPFRHIGVPANLTHGFAQTKRFSIYDQLPQRWRNSFDGRQLTDASKIQWEGILMGKFRE
jgi:hypothetical protein